MVGKEEEWRREGKRIKEEERKEVRVTFFVLTVVVREDKLHHVDDVLMLERVVPIES